MMKVIRGQMASLALRPRRYGLQCIPFLITLCLITWLTFVSLYVQPEEIERHRRTNRQIFHEIATLESSTGNMYIEDIQSRRKQSIKDYCR